MSGVRSVNKSFSSVRVLMLVGPRTKANGFEGIRNQDEAKTYKQGYKFGQSSCAGAKRFRGSNGSVVVSM